MQPRVCIKRLQMWLLSTARQYALKYMPLLFTGQHANQGTCTRLLPAQDYALLAASLRTAGRAQCPMVCVCHGLSHRMA